LSRVRIAGRVGVIVTLIALVGIVAAIPALGTSPEKTTQVIIGYDPGPDYACGFLLDDYQDIKVTSWYEFDSDGNYVGYREFVRYLSHIVTNPVNGRSLSLAGGLYNYFEPLDGPAVVTGSIGHFTIPGEGIVLHDAGRIELGLTGVEVIGGQHDYFLGPVIGGSHPEAFCDYLAG
jgi:hypothetical protein